MKIPFKKGHYHLLIYLIGKDASLIQTTCSFTNKKTFAPEPSLLEGTARYAGLLLAPAEGFV